VEFGVFKVTFERFLRYAVLEVIAMTKVPSHIVTILSNISEARKCIKFTSGVSNHLKTIIAPISNLARIEVGVEAAIIFTLSFCYGNASEFYCMADRQSVLATALSNWLHHQ
jgi:hypothetical protein